MTTKTLTIPDEHDILTFTAKVTDGGYLYMLQSYRDICLSPDDARLLGAWLVETFGTQMIGAGG